MRIQSLVPLSAPVFGLLPWGVLAHELLTRPFNNLPQNPSLIQGAVQPDPSPASLPSIPASGWTVVDSESIPISPFRLRKTKQTAPDSSVSAPPPSTLASQDLRRSIDPTKTLQSIHIPDVANLPIDAIVARSLNSQGPAAIAQLPETIILPSSIESIERRPSSPLSPPLALPTQPPTESIAEPPLIDDAYTLGAGDRILVSLFNVPEYSGEQQVLADGSVNLPLVGNLKIANMTIDMAERAIARRYEPELRYAVVTISLLRPRPLQVALAGEVRQPGSYVLSLIEDAQFPTIAQAIQAAGGTTQAANLRQVQIRRRQADASTLISVDLWQLVQNGDLSQNLALRDGDTITIPATSDVNIGETAQLAASSLAANASQTLDVAVVGEVFRPGAYKLGGSGETGERPTITQAIQMAGGIKPSGDLRQVQVRRPTRNGGEQLINVSFWDLLQTGDLRQDLVLQQGDTVIIPQADDLTPAESAQLASANLSPDAVQVNVIGEVKNPGTLQIPANTTLNQALLAAGGLNERSQKVVELIRLNPNGTITQQQIRVDLRQGIDSETNPILWNNDIIIAGRSRSARLSDQLNTILGPIIQLLPPLRLLF